MSHPTPNWLEIDPYSSLEEVISDTEDKTNNVCTQNINQEESLTSDKYYMRERKVKRPSRTLRSVVVHNYKEDSDDDSDYTLVTQSVKNINVGLRNPSKERMDAQCQISENRERQGLSLVNNDSVEQSSLVSTEPQSDLANNTGGGIMGKVSIPTPALSSLPVPMPSNPASVSSLSFHKRKPKPRGKHHRPASQLMTAVDNQDTTDNQNNQQNTNKPKSKFVTKEYGLIKRKKARKITCPMCKHGAYSQADASKHYHLSHPPIKCSKCPQLFNNLCSLRRHFYSHQELRFPCRNCGKSFLFESDLAAHHMKYRRHPGHMCNHEVDGKICGKWFFSNSDLTKHALTHTGKVHECLECGFTTLDKRYLHAHLYMYSDRLRYKCETVENNLNITHSLCAIG